MPFRELNNVQLDTLKELSNIGMGHAATALSQMIGQTVTHVQSNHEGEIIDLGVDVPPEKYVDAINDGAKILGMSALLTTTMPAMKSSIDAITAAGVRDNVKIVVGGAPLTQEYADEIGADGYAPDAASAVDIANGLLETM